MQTLKKNDCIFSKEEDIQKEYKLSEFIITAIAFCLAIIGLPLFTMIIL